MLFNSFSIQSFNIVDKFCLRPSGIYLKLFIFYLLYSGRLIQGNLYGGSIGFSSHRRIWTASSVSLLRQCGSKQRLLVFLHSIVFERLLSFSTQAVWFKATFIGFSSQYRIWTASSVSLLTQCGSKQRLLVFLHSIVFERLLSFSTQAVWFKATFIGFSSQRRIWAASSISLLRQCGSKQRLLVFLHSIVFERLPQFLYSGSVVQGNLYWFFFTASYLNGFLSFSTQTVWFKATFIGVFFHGVVFEQLPNFFYSGSVVQGQ